MSFLVGPISGALTAGGVYYGFKSLIQTRTEQHQRDLHHLSLQLDSPAQVHAPLPASARYHTDATLATAVKIQWNREIANLFAGAQEWDRRLGAWGKNLLYGD
ncbi:hypothetical protein BDN72DRAFT_746197, partial [Pluteus cervinus]